ncbi:FecR domain-containing protein [Ottowia sp. VDI28]|uniref:FecR domain-containing protein n=1 Tax=Ottowia sp. VDI28 TaxID=3133968 RepID=UPI003C2B0D42
MDAVEVEISPLPDPGSVSFHAKKQAAEWFALLRSGEATDADRVRWEAWLAGSEDHRRAWSYVERVSQRFAPIQTSPDPQTTADVLKTARGRLARRRQVLFGLAAFGGTGLLGWAAWRHPHLSILAEAWSADHHTGIGQRREVTLDDGTHVWLGPASAFNQEFRPDLRRLHLVRGEIFISTATDGSRPFVVDTRHGRLRALGTRFNVRVEDRWTTVSVYEGAVEVRCGRELTKVVVAGEQTRFDRQSIEETAGADLANEAWTRGTLIAQDMPLSRVMAELERYRYGHLAVAPDVAALGVYGSFPLDDTDRALAMLVAVLPIQVRSPLPWWSTIERDDRPRQSVSSGP